MFLIWIFRFINKSLFIHTFFSCLAQKPWFCLSCQFSWLWWLLFWLLLLWILTLKHYWTKTSLSLAHTVSDIIFSYCYILTYPAIFFAKFHDSVILYCCPFHALFSLYFYHFCFSVLKQYFQSSSERIKGIYLEKDWYYIFFDIFLYTAAWTTTLNSLTSYKFYRIVLSSQLAEWIHSPE